MIWMMVIMSFPVFGLALFRVAPLGIALPVYLSVTAISGVCHWLMMRAMRLPPQMGSQRMSGSVVRVLQWKGTKGQIAWNDEIWAAEVSRGNAPVEGDPVIIDRVSGLTVFVRLAGKPRAQGAVRPVEPSRREGCA